MRITVDSSEPSFTYRKSKALIAYLACTGQPSGREALGSLLWSDLDGPRALANLRVVLNDVRKALGRTLLASAESVALDPSSIAYLDVAGLQGTDDVASARAAADLYLGPFLQGFYIDHASEFEEWILRQREAYRLRMVTILSGCANRSLTEGNPADAVEMFSLLVELEPWHEGARRGLMAALAQSGDPEAAASEFRKLRNVLADELGAVPHPETIDMAERIVTGGSGSTRVGRLRRVAAPPSELIGRSNELNFIASILTEKSYRLVTLTGPGGVGKTHLGHETIFRLGGSTRDGAAFVDLSGVDEISDVPAAIAHALHFPMAGVREPVEELSAALRDCDALLLLDNLEHLVPGVSHIVSALVNGCADLTVLATSRVRLGLHTERVFLVQPLPLPAPGADLTALSESPAVELFLVRAKSAGVEIGDADKLDVAELCRLLDGLPLAIELVASHTRYFTPREIATSLWPHPPGGSNGKESVSPITPMTGNTVASGSSDSPARHRTLHDSIAWSYRLLPDASRRLFRHLGVFRSGIALDTLQAGFAPDIADTPSISSLIEASLVSRHRVNGMVRLRLMESTRAFAYDALIGASEYREAASRHLESYLSLAERADRLIRGPDQLVWLDRLETEHDNMRAALRYSLEHDVHRALRLAYALSWFWNVHGHLREGQMWLEEAAARAGDGEGCESELAYVLLRATLLTIRRGIPYRAETLQGENDSAAYLSRAEELLRDLGDDLGLIEVHNCRAIMAFFAEYDERLDPAIVTAVEPELRAAIATLKERGELWEAARVMNTMASGMFLIGEPERTLAYARESREIFESLGDLRGNAMALVMEAITIAEFGKLEAGRRLLHSSYTKARSVGDIVTVIQSLNALGCNLVKSKVRLEDASRMIAAGNRLAEDSGCQALAPYRAFIDRYCREGRSTLGDEKWDAAWRQGWHEGIDVAVA